MQMVSVLEKESVAEVSLEQICLGLHQDSAKLWLAARGENVKQDKNELMKRVANMFVVVLLLFVRVKKLKNKN